MPKIQTQSPPGAPLRAPRPAVRLEVAPDAELEAAARIAAQLTATPIAFVALFEANVPAFKASVGVGTRQLDRDFALRAHQGDASADAPLVIESLDTDPLLGTKPLVTGTPWLQFHAAMPVIDDDGAALGTLGVLDIRSRGLDASQRAGLRDLATLVRLALQARRKLDDLAREAMQDPLTGLASRRPFDQALQVELHHSMRTGEPFTLLRLSLDGICDIRNGFGNIDADSALREVSVRMAQQVRLGDVLARLGGDEFGIVMRHGEAPAAEVLATRIVEAVRRPLTLAGGEEVGVRVCIGIAAYTDEIESVQALLAHAEQALEAARLEYARRWNFFGRKFDGTTLRLVEPGAPAAAEGSAAPG